MHNKAIDLLIEVEEKFPIENWKIYGVDVWPILRKNLGLFLHVQNTDLVNDTHNNELILKKLKNIFLKIFYSFYLYFKNFSKNQYSLKRADILFFLGTYDRANLWNKWYCKEFEIIWNELKKNKISYLAYEIIHGSKTRIPRSSPSCYLLIFPGFIKVFSKLISYFIKHPPPLDQIDEVESYLAGRGCNTSKYLNLRVITAEILRIKILSLFYQLILKLNKPKLVFTICYYDTQGRAVVHACKSMGIPCYDVQHGIAGRNHYAYGAWKKIPSRGFNTLPDGFWVWDQKDLEAIEQWSTRKKTNLAHTVVGGNNWAHFCLNEEFLKSTDAQKDLSFLKNQSANYNILVTLQNSEIPKIIIDAIKTSSKDYKWWIRLHPTKLEDFKQQRLLAPFTDRVNYLEASRIPLYVILKFVGINVTAWSATARDANNFGIKTIFINPVSSNYFEDLYNDKKAYLALNSNELITQINEHYATSVGYQDNRQFYLRALKDILQKQAIL